MKNEFKNLQKENKSLREQLEIIASINKIEHEEHKNFWKLINDLINNEVEQEMHCNI